MTIRIIALTAALCTVLTACAATKIVTVPVKVVAKTVEATADVID